MMKYSSSEFNYLLFNMQKSEIDPGQIVTTFEDHVVRLKKI
jgi:hypothetical protein